MPYCPCPSRITAADFDPDSFASLKKRLVHQEVGCVELLLRVTEEQAARAVSSRTSRNCIANGVRTKGLKRFLPGILFTIVVILLALGDATGSRFVFGPPNPAR